MSDFTLTNGLINVGGILTETKVRKSRASEEAKIALGLDPTQEYKSSIGITKVQEQIVISSPVLGNRDTYIFPLATYEQPMKLVSLYSDSPQKDEFFLTLHNPQTFLVFSVTFNKNLLTLQLPQITIPQDYVLQVSSLKGVDKVTGVFVPVDVISLVVPEEVSGAVA